MIEHLEDLFHAYRLSTSNRRYEKNDTGWYTKISSLCVFLLVGGLNLKDWKIVGRGLGVCILHAQTHIFKDFYHLIHFIGRSVMKQVLPLIL